MTLAGNYVTRGDRGAIAVPLDDVSTRFEAVISQRGPVGIPVIGISWAQLRSKLDDHAAFTTLRAIASYFDEGGTRAVTSRVVGPTARTATLALRDAGARTVLTLTAAGLGTVGGRSVLAQAPGDWAHGIRATIVNGTGNDRVVTITLDGAVLATGTCRDEGDLQDLAQLSGLLLGPIGAGAWPVVAIRDQPLAGGDDDRANITVREVTAALDAFDEAVGPGSVCASGWTSVDAHTALAAHARAGLDGHNRFARADMPDVASASTLIAHAAQIRALDDARYIQLLAGWPQILVAGVTITVPPSGVHTGREARTDRESGPGPGQPCSWSFGEYVTPVGVSQTWSRADREAMTDTGITIIVQDGEGRIYAEDAITAADPVEFEQYAEVAGMRVTMAIHNEARAALRQRVQQTLDGHDHVAAATKGDLDVICLKWYGRDALRGATSQEAFATSVEAGSRSLTGNLQLRPSDSAKTVDLSITQVAAGDTI